jgi:hypothetical protein
MDATDTGEVTHRGMKAGPEAHDRSPRKPMPRASANGVIASSPKRLSDLMSPDDESTRGRCPRFYAEQVTRP